MKAKPCVECPPPGRPVARGRRLSREVRPSCLECAEKHLGAAYVLLAETRDGYAYRLRAVGHLFEAEDESQAWPELHDAIRESRVAFQATGQVPDWALFETLMAHFRQGAPGAVHAE